MIESRGRFAQAAIYALAAAAFVLICSLVPALDRPEAARNASLAPLTGGPAAPLSGLGLDPDAAVRAGFSDGE